MLCNKNIPHLLAKRTTSIPKADIYYLCVPDTQIGLVSKSIPRIGTCLHSAGSHDHQIIGNHPSRGVLHPIMSFPGPEIELPSGEIPATFCGDESAKQPALWLAKQLGFQVHVVSGDRRLYHAAAVMAGNYATVLLRMAGTLLEQCGINEPHKALLPLTMESINNASTAPLSMALTGPIARGDTETIKAHQEAIFEHFPHIFAAYEALRQATVSQLELEKKSNNDLK
jgi:predicted short-subunit dehydrogenase-like oxidoreductase (DUF2520 family)